MGAQNPDAAADTTVDEKATTATDDDQVDDLATDETSWGDGDDDGTDDDPSDESEESDPASDDSGDDWDKSDDEVEKDDDSESEESDDSSDEEQSEESEAEATKDPKAEEAEKQREQSAADAADKAFKAREAKRLADKAAAQQEYLDDAEDPQDLAVRQLQVNAYNQMIENTASKLATSLDKAAASIDLFRTGTDRQKVELISAAEDFELRFVRKDSNGDPIGIEVDPRTGLPADLTSFLQQKAESIKALAAEGAQRQVKDKSNQKKRTLTPPSRAPKKPKKDDLEAGFDEEAAKD